MAQAVSGVHSNVLSLLVPNSFPIVKKAEEARAWTIIINLCKYCIAGYFCEYLFS